MGRCNEQHLRQSGRNHPLGADFHMNMADYIQGRKSHADTHAPHLGWRICSKMDDGTIKMEHCDRIPSWDAVNCLIQFRCRRIGRASLPAKQADAAIGFACSQGCIFLERNRDRCSDSRCTLQIDPGIVVSIPLFCNVDNSCRNPL